MEVDPSFIGVWLVAGVGLTASVVMERLMCPTPKLTRAPFAWAIHTGVWLCLYGLYVIILGRPWFAANSVCALLLVIVLVNNAKFRSLREPFLFSDYEYFVDAIRHPRLYLPFFGWRNFALSVVGSLAAVYVGLEIEPTTTDRFELDGQLGSVLCLWAFAGALLISAKGSFDAISADPADDLSKFGLLAYLWAYGSKSMEKPIVSSPFVVGVPNSRRGSASLPNLIAVQSESFFDPRDIYASVRRDVLCEFDRVRSEAQAFGRLKVPAWGANTVRTEFAFLSGVDSEGLGVHRFNPYQAVAKGWDVPNLLTFLKKMGYRTVCIHPYPSTFYKRDTVFRRWDVDEFIDIRDFDDSDRFGPYIGDLAVAKRICSVIERGNQPVFVFAITMENHGPLHLESVHSGELARFYDGLLPLGCEDLSAYLRHLRNADAMIGFIRDWLASCQRDVSLCWYGDHVPIMPKVYDALGAPDGDVEYVIWNNHPEAMGIIERGEEAHLDAHELSLFWISSLGLLSDNHSTRQKIPPKSGGDSGL